MDLSKIRFTVETDQLKEAIGLLGQLKTASAGMKEAVAARKESVQVQREEIKTAKEQEKLAALQKKTSEAAAKAAEAEAKAIKAGAAAQKEAAGEIDSATRMVEKQTLAMKILRGETWDLAGAQISLGEGFTKSQANQLANLKLLGATAEQMRVLSSSFEQYNAITGLNTFDKSAGALSKMKKELAELATIQRLSAENTSLTKDEIVGLAREELRLTQQWISEKKSINELDGAIKNLRKEYTQLAVTLNQNKAEAEEMERQSKEAARQQIKDAKAVVDANKYVDKELEKVRFALDEVNKEYNRGSANAILRFENALKASGKTLEEQKILLTEYSNAMKAMQKASNNRAVDTISRAIGPQLTDIVVGLTTGQSPMMILLQQGGQLRDQFALAGVEAAAMGDAMKRAGREMVSSIYNTGKAVGQFLVGSFVDAGKAISNGLVGGAAKGFTALQVLNAEMVYGKGSAQALEAALLGTAKGSKLLESSIVRFIGIGIASSLAVTAAAFIGLGVALRSVIKEENELNLTMELSGAAMGLNLYSATALAKSYENLGVSVSNAMKAMTVFAKEGSSSGAMKDVTVLADYLEKTFDIPIEDTARRYAKFKDDALKNLLEVAKGTGKVRQETIDQVKQLLVVGDTYKAVELAQREASRAEMEAANQAEKHLGIWSQAANMAGKFASEIGNFFKGFNRVISFEEQIKAAKDSLKIMEISAMYSKRDVEEQKEKIRVLEANKKARDSANEKEAEASKNAAAALGIANKTKSAIEDVIRAKTKELGLSDYVAERFKQDFDLREQAELKTARYSREYHAQRMKYEKEWKDAQKKDQPREVKDNTLQTERNIMNDILSEKKKALSTELSVLKAYREAEFITESDYRNKSTSAYSASMQEQGTVLDNWYKKSLLALDGLRKSAKGNQSILNNLNNEQEKIEQTYKSMQGERKSDIFGFYTKSALDALKSLTDFNNKLQEIGREEDKLAASRKQEKEFSIASLYTDPDVIAGMRAFVAEQQRINDKISELEREKKKLDDLMEAAKANQTNAILFGDMESVKKSTAIYDQYAAKLLTAEEAMQKLKASLATSPEEAKRNAELQGSISRLNELQSVVRGLDMGSILAPGFDAATTAVGGLVGAMNQLIQYQEDYNKIMKEGTEEQKKSLKANNAKAQISQYAKLAGVTKDYFKQHTTGYKVLSVVEKAFRAQELYGVLENTASKIASMWEVTKATITTENENTIATEQGFLARSATYVKEIFARFSAMLGPYGTAAAAAVVAAIGLTAIGAVGSKGSFAPTNEGEGTVLGDPKAKSASLSNSLERLISVDTMTMKYSSAMQKSLQAIEYNTAGMGNLLARSGSISGLTSGVQTGTRNTINSNQLSGISLNNNILGQLAGLKMFKTSVNVVGSGISAADQSISDILSGGFQASNYADVVKKKKFAGMTYSSSSSTLVGEADQLLESQVTQLFRNLTDVMKSAAPILGVELSDAIIGGYKVSIGRVNLQGLSGDDLIKKLEDVFSAEGDKFAKAILPGFEDFQKVGEGYLETVVRVSSGIEEANVALDRFNINAVKYTDIVQKQGDVAAEIFRQSVMAYEGLNGISNIIGTLSGSLTDISETYKSLTDVRDVLSSIGFVGDIVGTSLIKGAGGLDNLSSSVSSFFENYLTETQQLQATTSQLTKEFAALGYSLPKNAEGFVNLVKGIDTSTEAGKELLGRVLSLSDAFSVLAENAANIEAERKGLEEELLKLQGNTNELRRRELEALDPSNRALQEQVWLLEEQKKATDELSNALKQAGKTIADEIKRLLGVSTSNNTSALQAEFAIKTASARSGNIDALNALPELSKALETATLGKATTQLEVDRMRSWLAGSLAETMKTLGINSDDSGNITIGSSLNGSTAPSATNPIIVDNTNQALLSELKTLNAKVADLEAAAVATALSNSKMQKLLDRVAADGSNLSVVINTEAAPVAVESYQQV